MCLLSGITSPPADFPSYIERNYAKIARETFSDSKHVNVVTNEMLFGFEADVVLRIKALGATRIVNLELDGDFHQRPSLLFSKNRDRCINHTVHCVLVQLFHSLHLVLNCMFYPETNFSQVFTRDTSS